MIADLVPVAFDATREFGPLLRVATDEKKGRGNVKIAQRVEQERGKDRIGTVVERQRDQLRSRAAIVRFLVEHTIDARRELIGEFVVDVHRGRDERRFEIALVDECAPPPAINAAASMMEATSFIARTSYGVGNAAARVIVAAKSRPT